LSPDPPKSSRFTPADSMPAALKVRDVKKMVIRHESECEFFMVAGSALIRSLIQAQQVT
jgi:hypothetical protein